MAIRDGMTLEASVSNDGFIEEHHKRLSLIVLAIFQSGQQGKLLAALQSEVKFDVKDLFLYRALKQALTGSFFEGSPEV